MSIIDQTQAVHEVGHVTIHAVNGVSDATVVVLPDGSPATAALVTAATTNRLALYLAGPAFELMLGEEFDHLSVGDKLQLGGTGLVKLMRHIGLNANDLDWIDADAPETHRVGRQMMLLSLRHKENFLKLAEWVQGVINDGNRCHIPLDEIREGLAGDELPYVLGAMPETSWRDAEQRQGMIATL